MNHTAVRVFAFFALLAMACGCSYEPDALTLNARAACSPVPLDGNRANESMKKEAFAGRPERDEVEKFFDAVKNANLEDVRSLAAKDRRLLSECDPSKRPAEGGTPLCVAVAAGNLAMVKQLVESGADARDRSAVCRAALLMDERGIADFAAIGWRVMNKRTQGGCLTGRLPVELSEMRELVKRQVGGEDRIAILQFLLERGADPNEYDPVCKMPVVCLAAYSSGDGRGVEALLRRGANPNGRNEAGNAALHMAVVSGNGGAVRELARCGADLEVKTANGSTALMIAVGFGETEMVKTLLSLGASVRTRDENDWNALFHAAESSLEDIFMMLVAQGVSRDDFESRKASVLGMASLRGSLPIVKQALAYGVNLESADSAGFTPFLSAVENGYVEIAETLLAHGANVMACEKHGANALNFASNSGSLELVKMLVSKGLDPNAANSFPLCGAAMYGRLDIVRYLLERGAKSDHGLQGMTPLMFLAMGPKQVNRGNREFMKRYPDNRSVVAGREEEYLTAAKLLISKGANVNAKEGNGLTPLHLALENGFERMADLLVSEGASLEGSSIIGETLLHAACEGGNMKYAALLIAKGVPVDARTAFGFTPLHVAADYGHPALVELLLNQQASCHAKTDAGLSALHVAAQGHQGSADQPPADADYLAVVELLIRRGADVREKVTRLGAPPLHFAAYSGNAQVVRVLLDKGAPADERDGSGNTALSVALVNNRPAVFEQLLAYGANASLVNGDGLSGWEYAKLKGYEEILMILKKHGLGGSQGQITGLNPTGAYRAGTGYEAATNAHGTAGLAHAWPDAADAQYELAVSYALGKGVATNDAEAVRCLQKAAAQGHVEAQAMLGYAWLQGRGTKKDPAEAAKWFRMAAEQNHADAEYELALLYSEGQGVIKDEAEAAKWFRKSADLGEAFAQAHLGLCYEKGQGVAKDEKEAVKWHLKAARQDVAQAQNNLARCYFNGLGAATNRSEAVAWWKRAAEHGLRQAQAALGVCLEKGFGVASNASAAVAWYRKAAEQDYAPAQLSLAYCYAGGRGVAKDEAEAFKWFSKAAELNVAAAQQVLAQWLDSGKGVPQNHQEAYAWYLLAVGGDASLEQQSPRLRAEIESKLTSERIVAARKRADELRLEVADRLKRNRSDEAMAQKEATAGMAGTHHLPATDPVTVAEQELTAAEKESGPDAPRVAACLCRLADAYIAKDQYALAATTFRRALAIREKALGSDHVEVAEVLEKLAAVYRKIGSWETEAVALEKRAAAIRAAKR